MYVHVITRQKYIFLNAAWLIPVRVSHVLLILFWWLVYGTCFQLKELINETEKILFQIHKTSTSLKQLKIN